MEPAVPSVLGVETSFRGRRWVPRLDGPGLRCAQAITQGHGLPDLLARVLASRQVTAETAAAYLAPSLRDLMPDPHVLQDMAAAVDRLCAAIRRGERIGLIGDYDVDGAASTALLADLLEHCGLDCKVHIPDRLSEGYGPSLDAVRRLAAAGVTLLITVDCGSSSHDALAEAARLGLETIVLDHHQTGADLPRAVALVNPNRQDDLSGLGHLCAAGIVFMTAVALMRALRLAGFWNGRTAPDLLAELDLVALGTVADVVPLVGLNRAFVVKGLAVAAQRRRVGLTHLIDLAGAKGPPNAWHLGFLIGPRINAGGRIGQSALGTELLRTRDAEAAARIAGELDRLNRDRRTIEAVAAEEAEAEALAMLSADDDSPVLVAAGPWHPGVVGLVAARLRERFGRPAFAVSLATGRGTGSGRSIPGVDLGAAVRAAVDAGLLLRGGGHAMAAGITLDPAQLGPFRSFLRARFAADVARLRRRDETAVDAALTAAAATPDLVAMLERAGPYGSASPEPLIVLPGHRLVDLQPVGEDHLRLALAAPDGTRIRAMAFRAARTPLEAGLMSRRGQTVHAAGTLALNAYRGTPRVELRLTDAAAPAAG